MSRYLRNLKKNLPSYTKWKDSPSNLAIVDLKKHRWTWSIHLCGKLAILGTILTAIGFGGSSRVFSIKAKAVLGSTVDPDLQLAFLGLINKIMDLFVTKALQLTAGVILTLWMTRGSGVRLADLELGEELTKPWEALSKFQGRWSSLGWSNAGWWRLLVTLTVSVCVLLQGLAINTIGMPKERWYPEEGYEDTVTHPIAQFQGFNWDNSWEAAWRTVGGGGMSWRFSGGYLASSTYLAFQKFAWLMELEPHGWRRFGISGTDYPALDTRFSGSSSRGVSVHENSAMDTFKWLQENGTGHAQRAIGMTGDMNLTLPSTLVNCHLSSELERCQISLSGNSSVVVQIPSDGAATNFSIHVDFATISNVSGTSCELPTTDKLFGAVCEVSFRRVLFPANVWNVSPEDTSAASINVWERKFDIEPEILPFTPIDAFIAKSLAQQLQATIMRLEHIVEDMSCAQWLMEIAREVHCRRVEYKSDIEALAPIVALLTNQLLAAGFWNVTYPDQPRSTSKLRWQLYGSGPRLPWAWSAVIILGVLTIAISASVMLSFWHTIVPGEWLRAGGMLVAANSSPPVAKLHQSLNKEKRELESIRVSIRESSRNGVVELVNAKDHKDLDLDQSYSWTA